MSIKKGRHRDLADTMRTVKADGVPAGRVHGVRLLDRGSASYGARTLTLEEWRAQQDSKSDFRL